MRRWAAAFAVALAACGGGAKSGSLADWKLRYGAVVVDLGAALDRVAAATKEGEPTGIRTSCAALRESVNEAQHARPVPDEKAQASWRSALDAITAGVTDCLGAMARGDARQLERSITQLRDARLKLDSATAALAA